MRRCETLVASRDNLLAKRDEIRKSIKQENETIAHFKEEQNARILDLRQESYYSRLHIKYLMFYLCSALLNEKQEKYYGFEAKKLEKQRVIDAEGNDEL